MLAWPEQLLDRHAGPRRPPADASRRSGAARADGRRSTAGASGAASRDHVRNRRRTSEVDSRRPDFERNRAAALAGVPRVGRPRASQRSSARSGGSPAGTIRVLPPLPSTRTDSASKSIDSSVERDRAPRRAARSRRRARTGPGRAAPAASRLGIRSSSAPTSPGLEHAGQAARPLGRVQQVGRVLVPRADGDLSPEQAAQGGELASHSGRSLPALGQRRDVAAQHAHVDGGGLDPRLGRPARELPGVDRVGGARLGGDRAAHQILVVGGQRRPPGWADRRGWTLTGRGSWRLRAWLECDSPWPRATCPDPRRAPSGDVDECPDRGVGIHLAGHAERHLDAAQALRGPVGRPREAVQRVAPVEVADPRDAGSR